MNDKVNKRRQPMSTQYQHLGEFSDWVEEAKRQTELFPALKPGAESREKIKALMGFSKGSEQARDVTVQRQWELDGLVGEEVSWSVGYGARTVAWVLKPIGATGALPAVLALHDHGGFKYCGKEKVMQGADEAPAYIHDWWTSAYGGRAWANALAREGFVVMAHDTFLWGSRRFDYETMRGALPDMAALLGKEALEPGAAPAEVEHYNRLAGPYEHLVSKYCNLLGTTLAGVVSHEDRIALNYLHGRTDVDAERVGCIGLSGGGNRSALLLSTADRLKAGAIIGLMSTYDGLLDHNVASHTWMLFPFLLSRYCDWPDLAASRAPAPLLVQYDNEDDLFTMDGMQAAHARLRQIYLEAGHPANYVGQFYPGPHKFDLEMQAAAFEWLKNTL
jgi:dienelactone hydrolase